MILKYVLWKEKSSDFLNCVDNVEIYEDNLKNINLKQQLSRWFLICSKAMRNKWWNRMWLWGKREGEVIVMVYHSRLVSILKK
jgi:hypothetical protein